MVKVADFLHKNARKKPNTDRLGKILPVVHTTRSYFLKNIALSGAIEPQFCPIFQEKLNYFFLGRPSYKHKSDASQAQYWELPSCFIFNYSAISNIRRMFPFDSGAHAGGLLPNFIQMMDLENFEIQGTLEQSSQIISAFFGSMHKYYNLKPKSESTFIKEYNIGPFDEEVRALHLLASPLVPGVVDDRRFCIELQSEDRVTLIPTQILAVVCPSIYMDSKWLRNKIEKEWQAEPITYNLFSLNYASYVSQIYDKVSDFYVRKGVFKTKGKKNAE